MKHTQIDVNHTTNEFELGAVTTGSVIPTAATAYKKGDLLVVSGDNVATHSAGTDFTDFHVVCLADVSADDADAKIAAGDEMPVYLSGVLNAAELSVDGTKLTEAQQVKARAEATRRTTLTFKTVE